MKDVNLLMYTVLNELHLYLGIFVYIRTSLKVTFVSNKVMIQMFQYTLLI